MHPLVLFTPHKHTCKRHAHLLVISLSRKWQQQARHHALERLVVERRGVGCGRASTPTPTTTPQAPRRRRRRRRRERVLLLLLPLLLLSRRLHEQGRLGRKAKAGAVADVVANPPSAARPTDERLCRRRPHHLVLVVVVLVVVVEVGLVLVRRVQLLLLLLVVVLLLVLLVLVRHSRRLLLLLLLLLVGRRRHRRRQRRRRSSSGSSRRGLRSRPFKQRRGRRRQVARAVAHGRVHQRHGHAQLARQDLQGGELLVDRHGRRHRGLRRRRHTVVAAAPGALAPTIPKRRRISRGHRRVHSRAPRSRRPASSLGRPSGSPSS
jgi:hypothetical protein